GAHQHATDRRQERDPGPGQGARGQRARHDVVPGGPGEVLDHLSEAGGRQPDAGHDRPRARYGMANSSTSPPARSLGDILDQRVGQLRRWVRLALDSLAIPADPLDSSAPTTTPTCNNPTSRRQGGRTLCTTLAVEPTSARGGSSPTAG